MSVRVWGVLLCGLSISIVSAQADDLAVQQDLKVERAAKLYLHRCINAAAVVYLDTGTFTALNGKNCQELIEHPAMFSDMPTEVMKQPAEVKNSVVQTGPQWPEGYEVTVTDQKGRKWQGNLRQYPVIKPTAPIDTATLKQAQAQAYDAYAQNYFQACVGQLNALLLDHPDAIKRWKGQSCSNVVDNLLIPTPPQKQVTSRLKANPDIAEQFEVTVTSENGKLYNWPEKPTPLPFTERNT